MDWTMAPAGMAEAAGKVLAGLLEHGHEAFFVGGCIRDELLSRPVHDMDLTTSALPEEVLSIFPRCVPTGLAHGTITVLQDNWGFEVTTYRTESGYADHRRPEHVDFVKDVREDLRRRDFTINAMCSALDGVLVDPFGGEKDLKQKLVRCVGNAEERFDEDALRMLRCVRFASVLDFAIAKNTWRGLMRQRDKLAHIAVERVRAELERIVLGPHPVRGLGLLARSGLLPRGKAPFPWTGSDLAAAAALTAGIGDLQDAHLRWALLLHALKRSASEADELLRAWTFPGATRSAVAGVLRVREAWDAALVEVPPGEGGTEELRRRWIAAVLACGTSAAEGWLTVLAALPQAAAGGAPERGATAAQRPHAATEAAFSAAGGAEPPAALAPGHGAPAAQRPITAAASAAPPIALLRSWIAGMPLHSLAELAVTGGELAKALGQRPGPWLGELLQRLLYAAATGDIPNDNQLLLQEAKRMILHEER